MTVRETFEQYLRSKGWNIHKTDETTTCIHSKAPAVWVILLSTCVGFDTEGSDLQLPKFVDYQDPGIFTLLDKLDTLIKNNPHEWFVL